jgi:hypothetical protein
LPVGSLNHAFPDFLDHVHAAGDIAAGGVLYRDHVEHINVYHYPPVYLYALGGTFAALDAVGLLGSAGAQRLAAKTVVALSTVAAAWVLFHLAAALADRRRAWLATVAFLANPVTLVGVYGGYFDAFVVVFVLLSLLLVVRDRPSLAGAAMALGFMSKPFPAVFGPVVAAYYLQGWPPGDADGVAARLDHDGVRDVLRFGVGGLAVLFAVSAPFLWLAPEAYLRYAFVYSFTRPAASLGLYFYFLPWATGTPLTTLLPAGYVLWVGAALWRSDLPGDRVLVDGSGVLLLGFLLLNRINYPHYLVYLAPLFSFVLARHYEGGTRLRGVLAWRPLSVAFGAVLASAAVWAYPWRLAVAGFKSHPLFWVGATAYFLSAFALLGLLAALLDEREPWLLVPGR